eukprot:XP_024452782.1 uncharacterized protein LOC18094823 [Populus trichocarpa]
MQALVRGHTRVRAQTVSMLENKAAQNSLTEYMSQTDLSEQAEKGWCDSPGTMDEVTEKLQMRKEEPLREREQLHIPSLDRNQDLAQAHIVEGQASQHCLLRISHRITAALDGAVWTIG